MTQHKFNKSWIEAGLPFPIFTSHSPELVTALADAAQGDHSTFEKLEKAYIPQDEEEEKVYKYFSERFQSLVDMCIK